MVRYTELGIVEKAMIKELEKLGWKFIDREEMDELRKNNFEEPLVIEKVKNAIEKINEIELSEKDWGYIHTRLRGILRNVEGMGEFLNIIRNGLLFRSERKEEERIIKLIDFEDMENNEFIVTRQFTIIEKEEKRPDIILLINGIPLVLTECKNPTRKIGGKWIDAYNQIKEKYEEDIPSLFKYVQFSICTNGMNTKYFPNSFKEKGADLTEEWKDPYPLGKEKFKDKAYESLLKTIDGLLSRGNFLDLVENFIFLRKRKGELSKTMSRYMQFRATKKICTRVEEGFKGGEEKKTGLVWHWLGAGKTYTMAFSARKLRRSLKMENPSIFVVVDREDLQDQIKRDFVSLGIAVEVVKSIKELIKFLRWGEEGKRGIFLTTLQKFQHKAFKEAKKRGKVELERENIIVLADESHRTHYGASLAPTMRRILKNAFIFGFTGTPIDKREKSTFRSFCPPKELYLDRYTMSDSLQDGFTLPLRYEARVPKDYQVKDLEKFSKLEKEFELSPKERRKLIRKLRPQRNFMKGKERIQKIAKDIAEHFSNSVKPTGLKAMVVTVDREACVLYKKALDEFLDTKESEIIMSNGAGGKIIKEYFENLKSRCKGKRLKDIQDEIIENFEKRESNPKILIVTNMLLQGFNCLELWAMYLDKPLKDHRVLQAMGRTDRPLPDKKFGLIIDYIGILSDIRKAFREFELKDRKELRLIIKHLKEEKKKFKKLLKKWWSFFKDVKKTDKRESIEEAYHILIENRKIKNFKEDIRKLMCLYNMLKSDPFIGDYKEKFNWLEKIYTAFLRKFEGKNIDEMKIEKYSRRVAKEIRESATFRKILEEQKPVEFTEEHLKKLKSTEEPNEVDAKKVMSSVEYKLNKLPRYPRLLYLKRKVERAREELEERGRETQEIFGDLVRIADEVYQRGTEEERIGEEIYPLYETFRMHFSETDENILIEISKAMLSSLKEKDLLYEDWYLKKEGMRKIKEEIKFYLLAESERIENFREKVDELTHDLFKTLKEREKYK